MTAALAPAGSVVLVTQLQDTGGNSTLVTFVLATPTEQVNLAGSLPAMVDPTPTLQAFGLNVTSLTFQDGYSPPPPSPPPLADWIDGPAGLTMILDIPFGTFALTAASYIQALQNGISDALGLPLGAVLITTYTMSPQGNTAISLDIPQYVADDKVSEHLGTTTSSSTATTTDATARFLGLFGNGDGLATVFTIIKSHAPLNKTVVPYLESTPEFIQALQRYNLPVEHVYLYSYGYTEPGRRRLLGLGGCGGTCAAMPLTQPACASGWSSTLQINVSYYSGGTTLTNKSKLLARRSHEHC